MSEERGAATELLPVSLSVNGRQLRECVEPRMLLVDFLREVLGLTGTHAGCEQGSCGACLVLVNRRPTLACLQLAAQLEGAEVETVEGLAPTEGVDSLNTLQCAFHERHALQCGFCTPGMLMAATALLRRSPHPSRSEVQEALVGNLCRCTGYAPIVDAILDASERIDAPVGPEARADQ